MKTLVIDTSTATLCLAIMENDERLVASSEVVDRRHSDRLLPAIEALLSEARLTMQHMEQIAVGQGPGSYTGVRIGVTAAKTLAWTLGVPLVGVSSLEALAYGAVDEARAEQTGHEWIIPLTDARRKRAYTAIYEVGGSGELSEFSERSEKLEQPLWQTIAADCVAPIAEWLHDIKESYMKLDEAQRPKRIVFVGEVDEFVEVLEPFQAELRLEAQAGAGVSANNGDVVSWTEQQMSAVTVGRLAWQRGESVQQEHDDVHRFVPNYTQLAEAEAALLRKRT